MTGPDLSLPSHEQAAQALVDSQTSLRLIEDRWLEVSDMVAYLRRVIPVHRRHPRQKARSA